MLQMLLAIFSSRARRPLGSLGALSVPRRRLLTMIGELVRNATPTSDPAHRSVRYRRSVALWSTLFQVMSEPEGRDLERRVPHWPGSIRRRFATALEHRRRKRWPHSPYSSRSLSLAFKVPHPHRCLGFRCRTTDSKFKILDLSAVRHLGWSACIARAFAVLLHCSVELRRGFGSTAVVSKRTGAGSR
jgi:hypothetical protein